MLPEKQVLPQHSRPESAALDLRGRSRLGARDRKIMGGPHFAPAPEENRDAVCSPQANSKARSAATKGAERCTRRVHSRCHRSEPTQDGQAIPDGRAEARVRATQANSSAEQRLLYHELLPTSSTESEEKHMCS